LGGSGKAEGFADGELSNHRQAALAAATPETRIGLPGLSDPPEVGGAIITYQVVRRATGTRRPLMAAAGSGSGPSQDFLQRTLFSQVYGQLSIEKSKEFWHGRGVYDRKVAGEDKTNVIARRPQADEAISDCPSVEIAAPAVGWLAMTCGAFAANLSYAQVGVRLIYVVAHPGRDGAVFCLTNGLGVV
jgi:hypothetical protein